MYGGRGSPVSLLVVVLEGPREYGGSTALGADGGSRGDGCGCDGGGGTAAGDVDAYVNTLAPSVGRSCRLVVETAGLRRYAPGPGMVYPAALTAAGNNNDGSVLGGCIR